jgi:CRISPR-associated endoribonuclease Cas6
MPYALTLTLDTRAARSLPDNCTPMLHANFFQWLEAIDANLAHLIDSGEGAKPFTVSPLRVEGERGRFRITLLDDDLFPILMAGMAKRSAVRIYANVLSIAVEPEIVQRTYEALVKQAGMGASVVLRFESPTSFKSNEMHYPLPDPVFVYGSYLTRWNTFAPPALRLDPNWLDWLRQTVAVARFKLESVEMKFKGYQQVGSVGQIEYRVIQPERSTEAALAGFNTLADYATFCGTGHKTTQGLGQTRRLREW